MRAVTTFLIQIWVLMVLMVVISVTGCASGDRLAQGEMGVFELVQRADRAYAQGSWMEAERYYQQVIARAPQDAYAWFRLGNTRLRQGALPAAIAAYEAALRRGAEPAKPRYNLATAYLLQAEQSLRAALTELPADSPGRGVISRRLGQLKALVYTPVEEVRSPGSGLIEAPSGRR